MECLIVCRVGDSFFAAQTSHLYGVSLLPRLLEAPIQREGIIGLFYFGDELIPLLDMGYFVLGKPLKVSWDRHVMVFTKEDLSFGILADRVEGFVFVKDIQGTGEHVEEGLVGRFVEKVIRSRGRTLFYIDPLRIYYEALGKVE